MEFILWLVLLAVNFGLFVYAWKEKLGILMLVVGAMFLTLGFYGAGVGFSEKKTFCVGFENNQTNTSDNTIECKTITENWKLNDFYKYVFIGWGIFSEILGLLLLFNNFFEREVIG